MKWRLCAFAFSILLAQACSSLGELINLDINGYCHYPASYPDGDVQNVRNFDGVGVLGGGLWSTPTVTGDGTLVFAPLPEADGTSTGVQVEVTNVTQGWALANPPPGYGQDLMRDYLFLYRPYGTSSTITISGLNTMSDYVAGRTNFNLVLYGSNRDPTDNDACTFTIGGLSENVGTSDVTSLTSFVEGVDYASFQGVPDSSGTITVAWQIQGTHSYAAFNGIQIQSVPESSTATLLSVGALGLLGFAWRRRSRQAGRSADAKFASFPRVALIPLHLVDADTKP